MKRIETSIQTDATPEELWAVLMDFPSYPAWNPMVVEISGEPRVGRPLRIKVAMKSGRVMTFGPTVAEYQQGHRFAWLGKLWIRGLFDGLHSFEIKAGTGGAVFIHAEEFRGLLPAFVGKLLKDTHESIVAMNEALVREVERRRNDRAATARSPQATAAPSRARGEG